MRKINRIFDTETTGPNKNKDKIVQLAWIDFEMGVVGDKHYKGQLSFMDTGFTEEGTISKDSHSILVNPGVPIPQGAINVHGITNEMAKKDGVSVEDAINDFFNKKFDSLIAHNLNFDYHILLNNIKGSDMEDSSKEKQIAILEEVNKECTMKSTVNLVKLPYNKPKPNKNRKKKKKYYNKKKSYKWPRLMELHKFLFGKGFEDAHDAMVDCDATLRCYLKLKGREDIKWAGL